MKKFYVRFHVGHGGHFWNPGHLSFVNEDNFQELINSCGDNLFDCREVYDEETGEEIPLDESEWNYHDAGGKILVEGRKAMEADTGVLNWDEGYDTDIVTTVDDMSEREEECLWEAYVADKVYMSDELKDAICSLKDMKRVHEIRIYPANWECLTQYGFATVRIDGNKGEFTEEEWRDMLSIQAFCPHSIDMIVDKLYSHEIINEEEEKA